MVEIKHSVSLCISTYNWPQALYLCLKSVEKQSVLPNEVIIGDDGSTGETAEIIQKLKATFPVSLIHVWQQDDGFRLSHIRNKSFAKATGDYIIQIDGDIILHTHFIKDHIRFARKSTFTCGTRMLLNAAVSQQLLLHPSQQVPYKGEKKYNAFRCVPLAHLIYLLQRGNSQVKYVIGANMAFFKKDLLLVNGYNESFKGWGKEDNDLAQRLCNAGIQLRFIKFAAIEYHIYHKTATNTNINLNESLLAETAKNNITFVKDGIINNNPLNEN